jgi:hypothetical protein
MSFEIRLPVHRSGLPSPAQWNEAIRGANFDLVLEEFDWATPGGFLPARLLGCASGFELWCNPTDDETVELAPGSDCVVTARLGGRWFELVCSMCSLAVLQSGTDSPLIDDWAQQTPQEAMTSARQHYNQARVIVEHLRRPGVSLDWNEPPLGDAETEESRRADLKALVSDRMLVRNLPWLGRRFRLRNRRRKELAEQLQMTSPGTAS